MTIDHDYSSIEQLIHTLLFTLERIAWVNQCQFTAVTKEEIEDHQDLIQDLDWNKAIKNNESWFVKLAQNI